MKTLVIHPKDYSTDFLAKIYQDKDWTIMTENFSKKALKEAIKYHQRIIMMGHGCEEGLFDGKFNSIIDSNYVYLLREKTCVAIWCNADVFFNKYSLKGLYTGMIISESDEAYLFSVFHCYDDIQNSNKAFADAMAVNIGESGDGVYHVDKIKIDYGLLAESNVVDFNKDKIYYNE